MSRNDFAGAYELLPTKFREAYIHPKIQEQVIVIGELKVKAMIQFQLGILASRMTTGGNITGGMDEFIARQLMELYPTESIADIKICFERGAMGRYGSIQRMDGITVGEWMEKYLDEKYSELEVNIEKRKLANISRLPVDGMDEIYMMIKSENSKWRAILEFNEREYRKKYDNIDAEQVEKLRAAEIEGKYVMPEIIEEINEKSYFAFNVDGHTIYAIDEYSAALTFKFALGRAPKEIKLAEVKA